MEEDERGRGQRERPDRPHGRAGRVQRTGHAPVEEEDAAHGVHGEASGSAVSPAGETATAKRLRSVALSKARAALETPWASVPVITHTGASSPVLVAAISPAPALRSE